MLIPASVANALLIVVLVIPGFVYGSARSVFRGPQSSRDTELSSRIATAVVVSVVFDSLYLITVAMAFPDVDLRPFAQQPEAFALTQPLVLGLVVLVLGVGIPAFSSPLLHFRIVWKPVDRPGAPRWLKRPARKGGYRNFPTA